MRTADLLFYSYDWFSVKENQYKQLKDEVANYASNRLLNTSVDDLCDYFVEKYSVEVPTLEVDSIIADQREAKVDKSHDPRYGPSLSGGPILVDGSTVEISIPFNGDHQAFQIRPSTYDLSPPRAKIVRNTLILEFTDVNQTSTQVKTQIDRTIEKIQNYLGNLSVDAEGFNSTIRERAKALIDSRRDKLLKNQSLVSSLGFQLREASSESRTYSAPSVRRKISASPPQASSSPYTPEPCLSNNDYDHILDVIQNMTHVMERSPAAFANMDEEDLRTHFLVQLNGHYEGQATGETFNYEGKTDILIRENGKNIFIGECKFWGGPKKMTETIDQVLGYSSWRDTKVAILIFNRNKELSKVLDSAKSTILEHENCKRLIKAESETYFRYLFAHRNDRNREMTLSVLIFDVPR